MDWTFKEYVQKINDLAVAAGVAEPGVPYCDAEAWRDSYNEELSPEDAWAEEVANFD